MMTHYEIIILYEKEYGEVIGYLNVKTTRIAEQQ